MQAWWRWASAGWSKAIQLWKLVFAVSLQNVSAIQVATYKRLVLISLLEHGKKPRLPSFYPNVHVRDIEAASDAYVSLADAYANDSTPMVLQRLASMSRQLSADENASLAQRVLRRLPLHQIRKTADVYASMRLVQLAEKIGFASHPLADGRNVVQALAEYIAEMQDPAVQLQGDVVVVGSCRNHGMAGDALDIEARWAAKIKDKVEETERLRNRLAELDQHLALTEDCSGNCTCWDTHSPCQLTLLADLQVSLSRVKELEAGQSLLERNDRVSRAGIEKHKADIHILRTENNQLRAEVLNYTKQLDDAQRSARQALHDANRQKDDVEIANLRLKSEHARVMRQLDDTKKKLEAATNDPASKIPVAKKLQPAVEIVELSTQRIASLEEELGKSERKLESIESELSAAKLEISERDLEIMRLNSEYAKLDVHGDEPEMRLADQIEYLHERIETLEKENRQAEGRLGEPAAADAEQVDEHRERPHEVQRLRTECENVKSLYAQTRDQLQELLRSGSSEAKQTEQALQRQLDRAQSRITQLESEALSMQADLQPARDRTKQIAQVAEAAGASSAERCSRKAQKAVDEQKAQYNGTWNEYTELVKQHRELDRSLKQAMAEVGEQRAKADGMEHKADRDHAAAGRRWSSKPAGKHWKPAQMTWPVCAQCKASHEHRVGQVREEREQAEKLRRAVEMAKEEYKRRLSKALEEGERDKERARHLRAERDGLRVQVTAQLHLRQRLEQRPGDAGSRILPPRLP
ncbi:hypothetical protein DL89DRAFT_260578 [Linderina pennispora]|uniref:COP9 signalosome complex subunit 3 N-terminal helical repeats domain-containing protein n=1 Tax=Linderina pennispora TaxID=61395 RepID=A0A1Y1VXG5_9FUNG|nr:uncharacterized protein DL89DRAFT_260578 [Linderina pennispora]ORX65893.1 hypothetical protein DL89DRAFT_260578 [Linderina pennispora]